MVVEEEGRYTITVVVTVLGPKQVAPYPTTDPAIAKSGTEGT